jgi:hypothetical protein
MFYTDHRVRGRRRERGVFPMWRKLNGLDRWMAMCE